jgi:putative ABC transport system permease protein
MTPEPHHGERTVDAPADPPGLALVRLAALIVPSSRRPEWVAEWEGELHYAWQDAARQRSTGPLSRARLLGRCLGALPDALWLRRNHGATDMLGLDLRYALRSIRRRPGFATVVILTLALGIGATTAIFSVVNGVLLRPLPYPEPERLVVLRGDPTDGDVEKVSPPTSYPDFVDFRDRATSFTALAAVRTYPATLTGAGGEPARVRATYATGDLWPMLGARAALGRGLLPDDERPDAPAVTVLSHALWQTRFGGDPGIVGRDITLDGRPVTVVGVMPAGLRLTGDTQLWRPVVPDEVDQARGVHRLSVIGRLKPGATIERAAAEVRGIARQLELQYPQDNAKRSAKVEPLRDALVGDTRPALLVLLGAVALVLLIGCANLASLFLARAAAREREIAVRTALGAGRGQLVRQWMTESLLLTLVGGAAGLLVAWGGMRALMAWAPRTIPRADEVALDLPVLLFLLGVSVATGLLFGILPTLHLRRADLSLGWLKDGGRGSTAGPSRRRLRQGLVVGEVALATVLVVGAALLLKSFWRVTHADPRFEPDGLIVAQLQLPPSRYNSLSKVVQFYERLRDEVAATPGALSVAVAYEHPLSEGWTSSFVIEGRPVPPPGQEPEARVRPVWPGYFRTVGVRLVRGRDLSERDRMGAPGAVVVNEAFVRRHFPGVDPIGQRIHRRSWWPEAPESFEIVGVAADEPFDGLTGEAGPATYFSHAQFPMSDMWLIVRGRPADLPALAAALRERVWSVDRDLPVEQVQTMREVLGASVAEPRFNTALVSLFAGVALLLAAVGIYGVLSYTVTQRTGEIGVRMALGAERGRVLRLVVGQGVGVALLGVVLGTVGALALSRVLTSLLYGVSEHDPAIFGGVVLLLTTVALAAAYLPARRASRIEPVVALRYE